MKKGFTLIELLVVIAIIAILASVVLSSLESAHAKARNAERNSDVKQLASAFSTGFIEGGLPTTAGWTCVSATCGGGYAAYAANQTVSDYIAPYIATLNDPADSARGYQGYIYYNPYAGGAAPYDGHSEDPGAYLAWTVETPLTPTSCGIGEPWQTGAGFIECHYKLQ